MKERFATVIAVVLLLAFGGTAQAVLVGTYVSDSAQPADRQITQGALVDNMDGSYTIESAGGHDLWDNFDSIFFANDQGNMLSGNGEIIARVRYNQSGGDWSRVGIQIRETLDADSAHFSADLAYRDGGKIENTHRHTTQGLTERDLNLNNQGYGWQWLKMTRTGNDFQAYTSSTGANWSPRGGVNTIPMAQDVHIGLFAHGRDDLTLTTAEFNNLGGAFTQSDGTLTSAASGFWRFGSTWDSGVPTASSAVVIDDADAVTVSSNGRSALRLTIEDTGSLTVSSGQTLSVGSRTVITSTAAPNALTINGGTFNAGTINAAAGSSILLNNGTLGTSTGGSIDMLTFSGNSTIDNGADLTVTTLSDGGNPAALVKRGGGTMWLDNAMGTGVLTNTATSFTIEDGTMVAKGINPLGGSTQPLVLLGGTLRVEPVRTVTDGPTLNLLGKWDFNNDDSTVDNIIRDSSGNGYDGQLVGGTTSSSNSAFVGAGNYVDLSGSTEKYVVVDTGSTQSTFDIDQMTIAAWVKGWPIEDPDSEPVVLYEPIISKGGGASDKGWQLRQYQDTGRPAATFPGLNPRASTAQAVSTIPDDGEWHHVAMTFGSSRTDFYIDGEHAGGKSGMSGTVQNTASRLVFGAMDTSGKSGGQGDLSIDPAMIANVMMDEIYIYSEAVDPQVIAGLAGTMQLNMSGTDLEVGGASTLYVDHNAEVPFGALTMNDGGELTTSGDAGDQLLEVVFASTTVASNATWVGFNAEVTTLYAGKLGPLGWAGIDANRNGGLPLTIAKTGANILDIDAPPQNIDNVTFQVAEGSLGLFGSLPGGTLGGRPINVLASTELVLFEGSAAALGASAVTLDSSTFTVLPDEFGAIDVFSADLTAKGDSTLNLPSFDSVEALVGTVKIADDTPTLTIIGDADDGTGSVYIDELQIQSGTSQLGLDPQVPTVIGAINVLGTGSVLAKIGQGPWNYSEAATITGNLSWKVQEGTFQLDGLNGSLAGRDVEVVEPGELKLTNGSDAALQGSAVTLSGGRFTVEPNGANPIFVNSATLTVPTGSSPTINFPTDATASVANVEIGDATLAVTGGAGSTNIGTLKLLTGTSQAGIDPQMGFSISNINIADAVADQNGKVTLTKVGSGIWTYAAPASVAGEQPGVKELKWQVQDGTFRVEGNSVLAGRDVLVSNGGNLRLTGGGDNAIVGSAVTLAGGTLSGEGSASQIYIDQADLTLTGDVTFDLPATIAPATGGVTTIHEVKMADSSLTILGGTGTVNITNIAIQPGTTQVGFDPQTTTVIGNITVTVGESVVLAKTGPGTWQYSQPTTITGGDATWKVQDGKFEMTGDNVLDGMPVTVTGSGELYLPEGTIAPLGTSPVILDGGTFFIEGAATRTPGLRGSLFRNIPRTEDPLNLGGATYNVSPTRVFTGDKGGTILTMTEEAGYNITFVGSTQIPDSSDATGNGWAPFPNLSSDWEDMVTAFSGTFTPRYSGVHNFHWNNDDVGLMYVDTDQNGVFDASERVAPWAWNSNGNVNLTAGEEYNAIYMAQEFGGGKNVYWLMTEPGGGEAVVNPGDGRGTWSQVERTTPIDFTGDGGAVLPLNWTVTGNSTLVATTGATATFPAPLMKGGVLTVDASGGTVIFGGGNADPLVPGVNIDPLATSVGFNAQASLELGVINLNQANVNISLAGTGNFVLSQTPIGIAPETTSAWQVNGGVVKLERIEIDPETQPGVFTEPLGGLPVAITGGTLQTITGEALGESEITLSGGTLKVQGTPVDVVENSIKASIFFGGNRDSALIDGIGDGTGNGGLLSKSPAQVLDFTAPILFADDAAFQAAFSAMGAVVDDYQSLFTAYFTAPVSGTYEFGTNRGDDPVRIYLDLNQNGRFETALGEQLTNRDCCGNAYNPNVTLEAGESYAWAAAHQEHGGGSSVEPTIQLPGGARMTVSAGGQPGFWHTGTYEALDLSDLDLTVTADSTVRLMTNYNASLGHITLVDGTVKLSGASQGYDVIDVTIAENATGVVGIVPSGGSLRIGMIDGGNSSATLRIGGSLNMVIASEEAGSSVGLDPSMYTQTVNMGGNENGNMTLELIGGRIVALRSWDGNPLGTLALKMTGGELVLAGAFSGLAARWDNELIINSGSDGTLTAGQAGVGMPGPIKFTVGTADRGIVLNGNLTINAEDRYELIFPGDISGPGDLTMPSGEVTVKGIISVNNLDVGGRLNAAGITAGDLDVMPGGHVYSSGSIAANSLNIDGRLNLIGAPGQRDISIADGGQLNVIGSNLNASGGALSVAGADVFVDFGRTLTYDQSLTVGSLDLKGTLHLRGMADLTINPGGTLTFDKGVILDMTGVYSGTLTTTDTDIVIEGGKLIFDNNVTADNAEITKGKMDTKSSHLTVTESINLKGTLFEISDGDTVQAAGSNLPDSGALTLNGGLVNVSGGGGATMLQEGLVFWLDASDTSTLFQDTAGNTGVTANGQPVARWEDKSPSQIVVTETPVASQPTYLSAIANLGGAPALHFDADALRSTNTTGVTGNADRTLISVWANAVNTGQNYQHTFHMGTPAADQAYGHSVSRAAAAGTPGNHYWGSGYDTTASGLNNPIIAVSTWNGSTNTDSWWANGDPVGTYTRGALNTGTNELTIGSRLAPVTEGINGDIAEILLFNRVLNQEELNEVGSFLAEKYGITTSYSGGGGVGSGTIYHPDTDFVLIASTDMRIDTEVRVTFGNLDLQSGADLEISAVQPFPGVSFNDVTAADGASVSAAGAGILVRGTVSPGGGGSTGTLNFDGNLTLLGSSTYAVDISGAGIDLIQNTGNTTLAGILELTATEGLSVFPDQRVILGGSGSIISQFTNDVAGSVLDFGVLVTGISYNPTNVTLQLTQGEKGDTNVDLRSDYDDVLAILEAGKFNQPQQGTWSEGDFTGDGSVDYDDIEALLAAGVFNKGSYSDSAGAEAAATAGGGGSVDLIVVQGEGLYIDANGTGISGYKINSDSAAFTGRPAKNLGLFRIDTDSQLAGGLGFSLSGRHFLGDVISASGGSEIFGTYTVDGVPGVFQFNVVAVPEPGTLAMLAAGGLGLLLLVVRRRRVFLARYETCDRRETMTKVAVALIAAGFTLTAVTRADIAGFGNGTGFTLNPGVVVPMVSDGTVTLTTQVNSQASSIYFNKKQPVELFRASFDYQFHSGSGNPADGVAFVLQNQAPDALGTTGGSMGYATVTDSAAIIINIYNPNTRGIGLGVGGTGFGSPYTPLGNIDLLSTNPIRFSIGYDGATANVHAEDLVTGDTFVTGLDVAIPTAVGATTAWVGFSGATGGENSVQTISNFTYQELRNLIWDNGAGDRMWSTPNNWNPDPFVPSNIGYAILEENADIVIVGPSGGYALGLTVDGGGIDIRDDSSLTIEQNASFGVDTRLDLGQGASLNVGGSGSFYTATLGNNAQLTFGGQSSIDTISSLGNNAQLTFGQGGSIGSVTASGPATIGTGGDLFVGSYTGGSGQFTKQGTGRLVLDTSGGKLIDLGDSVSIEGGTLSIKGGGNQWNPLNVPFTLDGGTLSVGYTVENITNVGTASTLSEWYFKGEFDQTSLNPLEFGLLNLIPVWGWDTRMVDDDGDEIPDRDEGVLEMAINFPHNYDMGTPEDPGDDELWDINRRSDGTAGYDNLGALWLGSVTVGGRLNDAVQLGGKKSYTFGTSSDNGSVIWVNRNGNGKFEQSNDETLNELIVNNPTGTQVGYVDLDDGTYPIAIGFYEATGAESMGARVAPSIVNSYLELATSDFVADEGYINPGSAFQEDVWSGFAGTHTMPNASGTSLAVIGADSGIQVTSDADVDLTVAMHDGATLATLPGPMGDYNLQVNLVGPTPGEPFYVGFDPQTPTNYDINAAGQKVVLGKVGTGTWTVAEDPLSNPGADSTWSIDGGTLALGAEGILGGRNVSVNEGGTLDLGDKPEWLGVAPGNSKITLAGGKLMLRDPLSDPISIEGFNDDGSVATVDGEGNPIPIRYDVAGGGLESATAMWSLNENALYPVHPFEGEEGAAYFVGWDLDNPFPIDPAPDRYVTLRPINVTDPTVREPEDPNQEVGLGLDPTTTPLAMVVALAASEDPWEDDADFLKIQLDLNYVDNDENGFLDFDVDKEYVIMEDSALADELLRVGPGGTELSPTFADFAFEIPDTVTTALGIRFQAWDTNEFEVIGFDDVRLAKSTQFDWSNLDITIDGGGTIHSQFANPLSDLPSVTILDGLLSTTGSPVTFQGINIDPEATEVGFDPQSPTDYGGININGLGITVFKGGPGTWVMNPSQLSGAENVNWEVRDGTLQPEGTNVFLGRPVKLIGELIPEDEELGIPEQYISGELLLLDDAETLLGAGAAMSTVTMAGGTITVGDKAGSEPPEAPIVTTLKLDVIADSTYSAITTDTLDIGLVTLKNGVIATSGSAKVNFAEGVFVSPLDASVDTVGLATNVRTDFGLIDANHEAVNITLDGSVELLLDKTPQNVEHATWEVLGGTTRLVDTDPAGDPLGSRDITVSGGRLVMEVTADGLPLGESAVTLAGGELEIVAELLGVIPGLHVGSLPGNPNTTDPNPEDRIDVLGPIESELQGNPGVWPWGAETTVVYTGGIYFGPGPGNVTYSFMENIDDWAVLTIDGEQILSNGAWDAPTANSITRPGGQWYDFDLRMSNGGGPGGRTDANGNIATIGFGYAVGDTNGDATEALYIHPRNADAQTADLFQVPSLDSIDLTDIDVTVTADSTLRLRTPFEAHVNELTLRDGIVTVTGAREGVTFANTVIIPGDTGVVGVNFQVPVVLGMLSATGVTGKFIKRGPFDLVLDGQLNGLTDVDGLTLVADGGQLIGIGGVDSMGTATLGIGNGDFVLASDTDFEDVTYDSAIVVQGRGSLTAGSGGIGGDGPLLLTLGSLSKGVNLNGGTFNVRTTDAYRLLILGPITGTGNMNMTGGDVTIDAPIDVGNLAIRGTFTAGGVTTEKVEIKSGSTLNSSGPITADVVDILGTLNLTGEGAERDVTINSGGALNLTGGNLDLEDGTLRMAEADLTIGFGRTLVYAGELTVANLDIAGTYRRRGGLAKAGDRDITIAPGGTLTLRDGAIINMTGLTSGVTPGVLTTTDANIVIEDGELTIADPLSAANMEIHQGMVNTNQAEIVLNESLLLGTTLYEPLAGATVALSGSIIPYSSTITFQGGELQVTDTADDWTIQDDVNLVFTGSSKLNLQGSGQVVFGSLALNGEVDVQSGDYSASDFTVGTIAGTNGSSLTGRTQMAFLLTDTLSPGVAAGDLATLEFLRGIELLDDATYRCEIGSAGAEFGEWPWITPVEPRGGPSGLPPAVWPGDGNDLAFVTGGSDIYVAGKLDLLAVDRLREEKNPGQIQWYGRTFRTIMEALGEANVQEEFALTPEARPDVYDPATLGKGHLGHGVFLVNLPSGDPAANRFDDGIQYDSSAKFIEVSLLQAADGDANADERVNFDDVVILLASGKWNKTLAELEANPALGPAEWFDGDFTGDQLLTFSDVAALLATGLWNQPTYTYPSAGKGAGDLDGNEVGGTVDLIIVPGEGLYIDTHGTSISSYKVDSASGDFDGEPAANLGLFRDDSDFQLAGGLGFALQGRHFLGDVIGSKGRDADIGNDISGSYTIDGVPGVFEFNVVVAAVPEPSALVLLATAALGLLLLAIRRRRKA